MGSKTTILLLVAVLGLGGFIWLVERKADTTERRREAMRRALRIESGSVTGLEFRTDDLQVAAVRRPGGWQLTSPVVARADDGAVERVLETLHDLSRSEIVTRDDMEERDLTPADYGLEDPRARIVLSMATGDRQILIGREAPVGGLLYIKEEGGEDVIVTTTNLLASLPTTAFDLRDRRLFTGLPGDVVRIDLRRPDGFLQVVRGKDYGWRIQKPVEARAAPVAVQGLVDTLFGAKVAEFVAETTAGSALYGLDDPRAQVSLIAGRGPGEQTLLIGKAVETATNLVYASVIGVDAVYAVSADILEALDVSVDDVRDRRLLTLLAGDIVSVSVVDGERKMELRRAVDGTWNIVEPLKVKADAHRVNLLLGEWTGARVEQFADEAATPTSMVLPLTVSFAVAAATAPTGSVPMTEGAAYNPVSPAVTFRLNAAPDPAGLVRVQIDGEKGSDLIGSDPLAVLSTDPLSFRDREVLAVAVENIRSVTIQSSTGLWEIRREGTNEFRVAGDVAAAIDAKALGDVLGQVRAVQALGFLPADPDPDDRRGLANPTGQITIGLSGETGISKTLLIGNNAGETTVYAAIRGQDAAFLLDKEVRDNLLRPLYNLPSTGQAPPDADGIPNVP